MFKVKAITPFLWFDNNAEEAANFYVGIFADSKIDKVARLTNTTVLTVNFQINGLTFTALNGGPIYKFNESVSFVIHCQTQQEVDYFWEKLGEGGDPKSQQCGWIKDKFGLSWQIVPDRLIELLTASDPPAAKRAMQAMMGMKKLIIADLEKAARG